MAREQGRAFIRSIRWGGENVTITITITITTVPTEAFQLPALERQKADRNAIQIRPRAAAPHDAVDVGVARGHFAPRHALPDKGPEDEDEDEERQRTVHRPFTRVHACAVGVHVHWHSEEATPAGILGHCRIIGHHGNRTHAGRRVGRGGRAAAAQRHLRLRNGGSGYHCWEICGGVRGEG